MTVLKFNPTASSMQFDGENTERIQEWLKSVGQSEQFTATEGDYVVVFLGQTRVLSKEAYHLAMHG